ncbi:glycosyltransferase family 4 protein [Rhodococcus sp. NPDC058521]|uniref:glycosyltransferase family 4 protein n=1 Tax=Rhodococcus sp. NPDC058521 TaxID=3346536 RepID=UPI0036513C01
MLWLSPWMRPLARVQVEVLRELGVNVKLVTTNQHPEADGSRDYELVLDARPKVPRTWKPFAGAVAEARRFGPDVVVTELVRDPRWLAFGALAPRIQVVHDDLPHDASELRPRWEERVFDTWGSSARATVTFSDYVGNAVRARRVRGAGGDVRVVPLTSDVTDARVPAVVGREERRDMVLVGRLNPYKNLEVVFDAWAEHTRGSHWQGDELVMIGPGDVRGPLPDHVRWIRGPYTYSDVLPILARAKASLVHYRRASQSGVQVLSMQLGVVPIASNCGALPEFQPTGGPVVDRDDVSGLAAAFDVYADPVVAAEGGQRARAHYEAVYSAKSAAAAWLEVIGDVVGSTS